MTNFKQTLRKKRQELFKAGQNYMQVYKNTRAYKLTSPATGALQTPFSDITFPSKL